MAVSPQGTVSQRLYGPCAESYENSWHPNYARRFVEVVNPQPGQRILGLCCGTGLDLFLVAEALERTGRPRDGGLAIGIDVTPEMLSVAKGNLHNMPQLQPRVQLLQYDVTQLETLCDPAVAEGSFDTAICSCAFALLDNPDAVVKSWRRFLKPPASPAETDSGRGQHYPGGTLVVDIPHETALRGGQIMERVAKRMGLKFPVNRSWIKSANSFYCVLLRNGFTVERIVRVDGVAGRGPRAYRYHHVEALYNAISRTPQFREMAAGAQPGMTLADVLRCSKSIFWDEFMEASGPMGQVVESDSVYVYVARRTY